eukprot:3094974-Lingulodinium_polyedra.AAC.1
MDGPRPGNEGLRPRRWVSGQGNGSRVPPAGVPNARRCQREGDLLPAETHGVAGRNGGVDGRD